MFNLDCRRLFQLWSTATVHHHAVRGSQFRQVYTLLRGAGKGQIKFDSVQLEAATGRNKPNSENHISDDPTLDTPLISAAP